MPKWRNVDASASKAGFRKEVWVRVPSSAQNFKYYGKIRRTQKET